MPQTTRMALPYPAGTEPANVPLDMQELADRLAAIAAGWLAPGTLAARPAPAAALDRHLYFAHDVNKVYVCVDAANDGTFVWEELSFAGHTHTKANITDFAHSHAIGDLPVAPSGTSSATQVVRADDARLSDARTPTVHTHTKADVTDFAHSHAIGDLPVAPSGTSSATQVVRADDSRLSNSRTPTAHTHPASDLTATGTRDATTFLRGDNTWSPIDLSTKLDKAGGTITGDLAVNGKTTLGDANTDVVRRKAIEVETDTRSITNTYTSGKLTQVLEKDGATTVKTTNLTYTGDNLTQVQELVDGLTITTTLTYNGDGTLASTSKTVV